MSEIQGYTNFPNRDPQPQEPKDPVPPPSEFLPPFRGCLSYRDVMAKMTPEQKDEVVLAFLYLIKWVGHVEQDSPAAGNWIRQTKNWIEQETKIGMGEYT